MNGLTIVCICSVALSTSLFAQAPATSPIATKPAAASSGQPVTDQQPRPGPEIQKLAYYVGTWKGQGETKGGPFGAAGKLSSTITCDWFTGGFQLVCRGEEKGPTGTRPFLNILAYDEKAKAYTEYGISGLGENEYTTGGSMVGNKRTFVKDLDSGMDGKPTKVRYTEVHVSPTAYTYRAEVSKAGEPWMVIAEGKVTKVK